MASHIARRSGRRQSRRRAYRGWWPPWSDPRHRPQLSVCTGVHGGQAVVGIPSSTSAFSSPAPPRSLPPGLQNLARCAMVRPSHRGSTPQLVNRDLPRSSRTAASPASLPFLSHDNQPDRSGAALHFERERAPIRSFECRRRGLSLVRSVSVRAFLRTHLHTNLVR